MGVPPLGWLEKSHVFKGILAAVRKKAEGGKRYIDKEPAPFSGKVEYAKSQKGPEDGD